MKWIRIVALFTVSLLLIGADEPVDRKGSFDGITIWVLPQTSVEHEKKAEFQRFVLTNEAQNETLVSGSSSEGIMWHILKRLEEVKANGIWLILSSIDLYSQDDLKEVEDLQARILDIEFPLYRCIHEEGCFEIKYDETYPKPGA